ncbi:hypothetical protein BJY52DRAFT_176630 [Lactarius psammicola]|nr:hypothetical protein BJY52DRAFT_176630 [Lactarius psammicola]
MRSISLLAILLTLAFFAAASPIIDQDKREPGGGGSIQGDNHDWKRSPSVPCLGGKVHPLCWIGCFCVSEKHNELGNLLCGHRSVFYLCGLLLSSDARRPGMYHLRARR